MGIFWSKLKRWLHLPSHDRASDVSMHGPRGSKFEESCSNAAGSRSVDWVIPNQLAVGQLPNDADIVQLKQQGIKAILSLCSQAEGQLPAAANEFFYCVHIPLPDSHQDSSLEPQALSDVVKVVRLNIQDYGATYVHCLAGIERSPTVCIAYLCRYHNLELWEALNWLKQVHPRTAPISEQLRVIQTYLKSMQNLQDS